MTQPSTLYAKLLGETAAISWIELQPFFARGALLWVDAHQDLIAVAEAVAENDQQRVAAWLAAGQLSKVEAPLAEDLLARDPTLWAVVVSPWVLVQERVAPALH
ncbi:MAG: DUF2288 domain-containing protein [Pseudomonas sp.]|uniref:DUF2288 domain-containing protein n=1 Tax=Pseudomonas sp. TaxID=306 RepID=UPI003395C1D6